MTDKNQRVIVPAGTFNTLNAQRTYYINAPNKTTRYANVRYAENIGIVSETANAYLSFFDGYTERRLCSISLKLIKWKRVRWLIAPFFIFQSIEIQVPLSEFLPLFLIIFAHAFFF